jgi:hypothetical protein
VKRPVVTRGRRKLAIVQKRHIDFAFNPRSRQENRTKRSAPASLYPEVSGVSGRQQHPTASSTSGMKIGVGPRGAARSQLPPLCDGYGQEGRREGPVTSFARAPTIQGQHIDPPVTAGSPRAIMDFGTSTAEVINIDTTSLPRS